MISKSQIFKEENPDLSHRGIADLHKLDRHERLAKGVYGEVKSPTFLNEVRLNHQPSYLKSHETAQRMRNLTRNGLEPDRFVDVRCFFTGVRCDWPQPNSPRYVDRSFRVIPWMGSRDHLVPVRRFVADCPVNVNKYPDGQVWCCNVANTTLGIVPLPVRLKIRQWLSTAKFDPLDRSLQAGDNMRWIIVDMLRDFRIRGRLVWSRKQNGSWWIPESHPLMEKWWRIEMEFLQLPQEERNEYIEEFAYRF